MAAISVTDSVLLGTLPQAHRLPWVVIWSITVLTALAMAVADFIVVCSSYYLLNSKVTAVEGIVVGNGVKGLINGAILLAVICAGFSLVSSLLVCYISPSCAGGGLPEAKSYMNGNDMPKLFNSRTLFVRTVGIIFSVAAGFPIGRESPSICIGCNIGVAVVRVLAKPHMRQAAPGTQTVEVDTERYMDARRIGAAIGGAAGMSAVFKAPIGGLLYMLEEVSSTSWSEELTFRGFACTTLCYIVSKLLLGGFGGFGAFQDLFKYTQPINRLASNVDWGTIDILFVSIMAAVLGFCSSLYTFAILWVWSFRKRCYDSLAARSVPIRVVKVVECITFAVACAFIFVGLSLMVDCTPTTDVGQFNVTNAQPLLQFNCGPDEKNMAASLLLSSSEDMLKRLYALDKNSGGGQGQKTDFEAFTLLVVFGGYLLLNMSLTGLSLPMGMFFPSMIIGALTGRMFGQSLALCFNSWNINYQPLGAGVYALVGSAAFLGGFTHTTLAVVVFLTELASDLYLTAPLCLSVFVANIAAKAIDHYGHDLRLMWLKDVPHLDAEIPEDLDDSGVTAAELCEAFNPRCHLPPTTHPDEVRRALDFLEVQLQSGMCFNAFLPVISGETCVGLVSKNRLEKYLLGMSSLRTNTTNRASGVANSQTGAPASSLPNSSLTSQGGPGGGTGSVNRPLLTVPVQETNSMEDLIEDLGGAFSPEQNIQVSALMDPTPFLVLENTPVHRLYPVFVRAGAAVACVVTKTGEFRGTISRVNLMQACRRTQDGHPPVSPLPSDSRR